MKIEEATRVIASSLESGGRLFVCGNGGSFSQAQHFTGELVGRFKKERKGLAAYALGSNGAVLTALSNDYNFENALARELEALGKAGDVLVALSTSGQSKNILAAVQKAKELGIKTIGLSGKAGELKNLVGLSLEVDSADTPRIQEEHLAMIHDISARVEDLIFFHGKASRNNK